MKAAITILIILALGLGAALFYQHTKSVEFKKDADTKIVTLSNQLEKVKGDLDEQQNVSMKLEKNLKEKSKELLTTSNSLVKTAAELAQEKQAAAAGCEPNPNARRRYPRRFWEKAPR